MAKVKAPYVYDDTGIKKELDGRKDLYNRQKRQNTECFDDNHFPPYRKQDCNRDSMFGTGRYIIHIVSTYGDTNRVQFITFLVMEEWLS